MVAATFERNFVWAIWVLWAFLLMGLAHTELVTCSWFQSFRFWAGQVVPTVNHPPVREVIDPVVASSFLAILWATSPVLWFGFRNQTAEKFFTRVDWTAPFSGRILMGVGIMTVCAIVAFGYDFDSRRMTNRLVANPIGFSVVASVFAGFPWYTLALLKAWRSKINAYIQRQGTS